MGLKKRLSFRWRIFLPLVGSLWFIIALLVAYQYKREVTYRTENIHKQLTFINERIIDCYENNNDLTPFMNFLNQYFDNSIFDEAMISVFDKDGHIMYSIGQPLIQDFSQTWKFIEFQDAEKYGEGIDTRGKGQSMFYYTARKSHDGRLYVHTAMPYTVTISDAIAADKDLWFIIAAMAIMVVVIVYYSTRYVSNNIVLLRNFATQANNGNLAEFDDSKFAHDELGDISREIIELYYEKNEAVEKSEREHKIALRAVEDKARMKREMSNNINHEIKTPVAMIKGYIDTILENPDMDEVTRQRFLEKTRSSVERLVGLLNDVSTITRLEEGTTNIPVTDVNVHDLMFSLADELESAGVMKDMKFKFDLPFDCVVNGNTTLLVTVFTNLIKNAVQHSHGTKMELVLISESERYYSFSFIDNGNGVDPSAIPHLFDRFYRADTGRSRKVGGTGLGLSIVKNTIEALGGTISVHNRSTGGLQFLFTLEKWTPNQPPRTLGPKPKENPDPEH